MSKANNANNANNTNNTNNTWVLLRDADGRLEGLDNSVVYNKVVITANMVREGWSVVSEGMSRDEITSMMSLINGNITAQDTRVSTGE